MSYGSATHHGMYDSTLCRPDRRRPLAIERVEALGWYTCRESRTTPASMSDHWS